MILTFNGKNKVVHDFSKLQKSIFSKLDITNSLISWIENDVNGRGNKNIMLAMKEKSLKQQSMSTI